ncbi:hypothetical protein ES707_13046 [subsurface metagenome]
MVEASLWQFCNFLTVVLFTIDLSKWRLMKLLASSIVWSSVDVPRNVSKYCNESTPNKSLMYVFNLVYSGFDGLVRPALLINATFSIIPTNLSAMATNLASEPSLSILPLINGFISSRKYI